MTTETETYSIVKRGRRHIVVGDTRVAPKGHLGKYGMGLNFDRDTCEWWTARADLAAPGVTMTPIRTPLTAERLQGIAAHAPTTSCELAPHSLEQLLSVGWRLFESLRKKV